MHLTDSAVRRQLFLDVLDGTKALVSVSGRFCIAPREKVSEVKLQLMSLQLCEWSGQRVQLAWEA